LHFRKLCDGCVRPEFDMNKPEKKRVAIAGATGMVGRRFAELLVDHPWYTIEMLVGYKSAGMSYGEIWDEKEAALGEHYGKQFWVRQPCPEQLKCRQVQSFDELLDSEAIELVFSAIPHNVWQLEQQLIRRGFTIFSNSPYGRFEEENPLVVAEVNGEEIATQQFIKNPNCVSSGLALILAPLKSRYGLREVSVVTFQSLTGKGDAKYPQELVVGNVYPLHQSEERTEEYIIKEMHKIFKEKIPISVSCNRVYVQEGHFADLKVKTHRRIDTCDEVSELLRTFDPLRNLMLPSSPGSPLIVLDEVGRPRPKQDAFHNQGMTVAVGGISLKDDVFDLRLQYVVNNLVRGAAGGAILNCDL